MSEIFANKIDVIANETLGAELAVYFYEVIMRQDGLENEYKDLTKYGGIDIGNFNIEKASGEPYKVTLFLKDGEHYVNFSIDERTKIVLVPYQSLITYIGAKIWEDREY